VLEFAWHARGHGFFPSTTHTHTHTRARALETKTESLSKKIGDKRRTKLLKPVILATWEVEIGRIMVQGLN
jgi:hypothetical protein